MERFISFLSLSPFMFLLSFATLLFVATFIYTTTFCQNCFFLQITYLLLLSSNQYISIVCSPVMQFQFIRRLELTFRLNMHSFGG
jgi:Na+/H+ antiporter NhaB